MWKIFYHNDFSCKFKCNLNGKSKAHGEKRKLNKLQMMMYGKNGSKHEQTLWHIQPTETWNPLSFRLNYNYKPSKFQQRLFYPVLLRITVKIRFSQVLLSVHSKRFFVISLFQIIIRRIFLVQTNLNCKFSAQRISFQFNCGFVYPLTTKPH